MEFPKTLDGAEVLMYTNEGHYENLVAEDGSFVIPIRYLAICQYQNHKADGYYLFECNQDIEVETDGLFDTIEDAKEYVFRKIADVKWYSGQENPAEERPI